MLFFLMIFALAAAALFGLQIMDIENLHPRNQPLKKPREISTGRVPSRRPARLTPSEGLPHTS